MTFLGKPGPPPYQVIKHFHASSGSIIKSLYNYIECHFVKFYDKIGFKLARMFSFNIRVIDF